MKKIKSITVKDSSFFDKDFTINFSDKLNCLMGGRGTGKSTLLYFISAALDNSAEENSTISNILKANLQNGTIFLNLEDEEGKNYEVVKTFGDEPQTHTLPLKRHLSLESLSENFECDIYPALAIEEIGKNSYDRLKLIDKRIRNEASYAKSEIKKLQIALKQNAVLTRGENAKVVQIKQQLLNFKTVEEDLKRQKAEKPDEIKQKEQEEFEMADTNEKIRNSEKRYVKKVIDKLNETQANLKEVNEDIANFLMIAADIKGFNNKDLIGGINSELENTLNKILKDNEANIKLINPAVAKINKLFLELKDIHQKQQSEFVLLKQKFDKHKEYINRYNQLSKKVEEKNILEKEIETIELKRQKVQSQRNLLVNQLNEKKKDLFNLRKRIIDDLNKELDGSVKITLKFGGITEEYENQLRNALRGSNLRYNAIIPYIVQSLTPDRFAATIHQKDFETLKNVAQIDEERSNAIISALSESEEIYDIEGLYSEDLPEFFLKIDAKYDKDKNAKENYKKSDELSTGQRCTTVLPIVFAVSDNPLLIDQPEDNLDNRYITDAIHKIIREQKEKRQLIFITHNPNIPVLSNAEHNIFLSYDDKKSKIDVLGTINKVKANVLSLLEGGKEAFERRRVLYGEN
jgi:ABC-type cobalamin/Fe3+-siderophores transport system ATPase subunit